MKLVCLRYTAALLLALAGNLAPAMSATPPNWVATWAAAPDSAGPALPPQTIRQVVRTSVGGDSVRIRLSNLHGAGPVGIGPVHVAVRATGASIEPGSDRALTFNGSPTVTIANGDSVLSDAVDMS
ncbi:MAG TPA: hypothetical protein VF616_08715, partial [Duganella sp.]